MSLTPLGTRALFLGLVLLVGAAAPAIAQDDDDPYGPTSTTPPPQEEVSCGLSARVGQVGDEVVATVRDVAVGTRVEIRFDGEVVASGVVTSSGEQAAPAVIAGRLGAKVAAQAERGSIELRWRVPQRANGSYTVVAVGEGFTVGCGPSGRFTVRGGAEAKGGRLGDTGIQVAVFLAVAAALIVAGMVARHAAKERRHRRLRSRPGAESPVGAP